MANHICRDYQLNGTTNWSGSPYAMILYLRRVLRYFVVGRTGYPVDTVGGGLLVATGDTTPAAATPTFPAGRRAGINYGGGLENHVGVNSADHVVSAGDVNKILVLRSSANPRHNSGLFKVTGVDVGNNRFIVDYRSSENPPAEADDSMDWYLYENESSAPTTGSPNGGSGYRSDGTSTTPRIVLQSPHATGWQVRICMETSNDYSTNGTVPVWTSCPGFGGDSAGDFPVAGRHTHTAMFHNTSSSDYKGCTIGGGSNSTQNYRFYAVGDDTGQFVAFFYRYLAGSTDDHVVMFGIPDNEPSVPADDAGRLFCYGSADSGNIGAYLNNITYRMGGANVGDAGVGMSFSADFGQPISATVSCWCYAYAISYNNTPAFDGLAGDNPFTGTTDLLSVNILQGTEDEQYFGGTSVLDRAPRVMGSIPFLRQGRTNFADFTLTDDKAWMHMQNEVWIDWQGPAVLA